MKRMVYLSYAKLIVRFGMRFSHRMPCLLLLSCVVILPIALSGQESAAHAPKQSFSTAGRNSTPGQQHAMGADLPAWAYGFDNTTEAPMPDIVAHGHKPDVTACSFCHYPNGKGRPVNTNLAGLPYSYILQTLDDFRNGVRRSSDTRKSNTNSMIGFAKSMSDDEMKAAAQYFS